MKHKREQLRFVQLLFVMPMFVLAITSHGPAVDAAHAHNAALFTLGVIVIGVVGGLAVQVKINRLAKRQREEQLKTQAEEAAQQPGVWPPPPQG